MILNKTLVVEGLGHALPAVERIRVETGTFARFEQLRASSPKGSWVGYVRAGALRVEFLAGLSALLDRSESRGGILVPLNPVAGVPAIWRELPPSVAALIPQPQGFAAIWGRSAGCGQPLGLEMSEGLASGEWVVEPVADAPLAVLAEQEINDLTPAHPTVEATWSERVGEVALSRLLPVRSRTNLTALRAGLWLLRDDLDASHSLSQAIEGAGGGHGDYWHAILHRREPDYGNAKYWLRRVGRHPTMHALARNLDAGAFGPIPEVWSARLSRGGWDSQAFVDLCEAAENAEELARMARRIQWCEMLNLLCVTCTAAMEK